jgi:hypothetical protein
MPARVKYIPFLNMLVEGKNIQNEDMTKNRREKPKNILKK